VPIWLRQDRAGSGRPPRRSRAEIAAAGIAIADREGLDAVSMRRVAAALGTGAATLYRYLDTRDDLIDLMIDATGAEYELTAPTGDWLADLVGIGEQMRAIIRRHPWLASLLPARSPLGPHGAALLEHVLHALAGHPAAAAAKLEAFALLMAVTATFATAELDGDVRLRQRNAAYLQHAISSGEHPYLASTLSGQPAEAPDPATRYPAILSRLLTGLLGS
jgi:AcrR family transcriptional regulator